MRPILIDTNAYVAYKYNDPQVVEVIQQAEILAISPIVLGELLGGFEYGKQGRKNHDELQAFLSSSRARLFSLSSDTATFYSQIYRALRNKGKPIPTNDMWIAAQTLEQGSVLCTFDKHFKVIDGLVSGSTLADLVI